MYPCQPVRGRNPTGARLGSSSRSVGNNRFPHAPAWGKYALVGANGGSPRRPYLTSTSPHPWGKHSPHLNPPRTRGGSVRGRLGGGQQLPHVENPPRRHLPGAGIRAATCGNAGFQWAPTLGGECYPSTPTASGSTSTPQFQWAPTLGGECYTSPTTRGNP